MFRAGQLVQFTIKGDLEKVMKSLMNTFPETEVEGIIIQIKKDFDGELPEEIIGFDIIQEDTLINAIEKSTEHLGGDSLSLVRIIKALFDRRDNNSVKIFDIPELTLPLGFECTVIRTFLEGYFFNTPENKRKEELLKLIWDKWEDLKTMKNIFDYTGKIFDVTLYNMSRN
jgi:hypothetical protein